MSQRTIDLILSGLASAAALLLSWPYFRDFGSLAESRAAWIAYFVIGYALAVYVFYAFLHNLHELFAHEHEHGTEPDAGGEAES